MNLSPGLELDILVAEKVMGYERSPDGVVYLDTLDKSKTFYCIAGSPASEEVNVLEFIDGKWWQYEFLPSQRISDAWGVVEEGRKGFGYIEILPYGSAMKRSLEPIKGNIHTRTETAPHSICMGALKAIELQT